MVQGRVHRLGDVKIKDTRGDINTPMVTAGVIYADTIKAHMVIAQDIYVDDLKRD